MEKEFFSYEQAVALKELGFEASPIGGHQQGSVFYFENGKIYYDYRPIYSSTSHVGQILAPLKQQVFRWFREKHKLYAHVRESYSFDNSLEFVAQINGSHISHGIKDKPINRFDTYEEAENTCIDKLIELAKQQNNESK